MNRRQGNSSNSDAGIGATGKSSRKLPALQWYPGDWRKDIAVQSLSFHDRGVWFEILNLMHESERRGLLLLNGIAMSEDALARILGLDKQTLTLTITTLLTTGVASRDEDTGALMNRRMVRDENLRTVRAEAGKKGGNPVLLKRKETSSVKHNSTPSTSSSISTSDNLTLNRSDAKILQIAQAYPKLSQLRDETEIPPVIANKIIDAIEKDGAMRVLLGVKGYAASVSDLGPQFIPDASKFFAEFRYRSFIESAESKKRAIRPDEYMQEARPL